MPSEILVNSLGLTYKGTVGITTATLPDVCKTPSPGGPVPIPYPNIAQQSSLADGTTTVKAKGQMIAIKPSNYSRSNGDEPGTAGGVTSSTNMKEATWITWSFDVKMDGENACRHTDKMFQNHKNTADLAGNLDPAVTASAEHEIKCAIQKCDQKNENGNNYDVSTTAAGAPMPPGAQCSALGSKKHSCVKRTLEKNPKTACRCERTFDMGTPSSPNVPPVELPQGSPQLPAGQGRRPDVVVGGPNPASYNVYDAKFPCSQAVRGGQTTGSMPSDPGRNGASMMGRSQRNAYRDISNGGKVVPLAPVDCASEKCE